MARHKRYFLKNQPLHIIQRGNNRQAIFFAPEDYAQYRAWLGEAASGYGLVIHAYVLMTNHVHLLATPQEEVSVPRTLQSLGRRYVRHINRLHRRSGTLWEGRYRAAPIDSDACFFDCCRYIELNPVRAGMVARPRDYPWSSYRAHGHGAPDALLTDHTLYRALARNAADRQKEYRLRFRTLGGIDDVEDEDVVAACPHRTEREPQDLHRALLEAVRREGIPVCERTCRSVWRFWA